MPVALTSASKRVPQAKYHSKKIDLVFTFPVDGSIELVAQRTKYAAKRTGSVGVAGCRGSLFISLIGLRSLVWCSFM